MMLINTYYIRQARGDNYITNKLNIFFTQTEKDLCINFQSNLRFNSNNREII